MSIAFMTPTDLYRCVSATGDATLFAGGDAEHEMRTRAATIINNDFIYVFTLHPILVRGKMFDNIGQNQDACHRMATLRNHIESELELAYDRRRNGDLASAFQHLERAHVLGQASTYDHTRIHWQMFKLGLKIVKSWEKEWTK